MKDLRQMVKIKGVKTMIYLCGFLGVMAVICIVSEIVYKLDIKRYKESLQKKEGEK